jgi:hypothetical protein
LGFVLKTFYFLPVTGCYLIKQRTAASIPAGSHPDISQTVRRLPGRKTRAVWAVQITYLFPYARKGVKYPEFDSFRKEEDQIKGVSISF